MTWYYKSHTGMELGPVSPLELLDLIRNGSVLRDTQVKKNDSQWVKAEEVNGLMANAAKPSFAYYCESCGKQVPKPPCRCLNCDMNLDKATQKLVQHDLDEVDRKTRRALGQLFLIARVEMACRDRLKPHREKCRPNPLRAIPVAGCLG